MVEVQSVWSRNILYDKNIFVDIGGIVDCINFHYNIKHSIALTVKNFITYLQQHKFIEWFIPLHEDNSCWESSTQIFVSIIRVSTHTTFTTSFGIRNFGCGSEPSVKKTERQI